MSRVPDHVLLAQAVAAGMASVKAAPVAPSAPTTTTDDMINEAMAARRAFLAAAEEARRHFLPEDLAAWAKGEVKS